MVMQFYPSHVVRHTYVHSLSHLFVIEAPEVNLELKNIEIPFAPEIGEENSNRYKSDFKLTSSRGIAMSVYNDDEEVNDIYISE